ncbi:MAG TPA: hypothetical protein VHE81_15910 [Lacipirellulaceae bacterium]|nr:hypothetical protein [Lacipirellulaceae bacterium]
MPISRLQRRQQLRVNQYDRVSSWLVALLFMAGVVVGALVIIYFTHRFIITDVSVPVMPVASGGGGTGGETGTPGGSELEPPGVEDAPPITEPPTRDTLSAIASAVSDRTAILADEQIDVGAQPTAGVGAGDHRTPGFGGGRGGGAGGGIGSGFGPGRGNGPGEPRREIRFEPASLLEYAQWLDYFKIELGVLNPQDNKVYYAYNLSQEKPDVRVGDPTQEQRLYMNPTDSQFAALDRELAKKAGIADKGRIILQFYPHEAQAILVGLERRRADDGARKPEEIRRTVFRVTHKGNDFVFSVEDQSYR